MSATKINPKKTDSLATISSLLSSSKSVAVVDYTGLKVGQATELRKLIRKSGGTMLVTKNTLFKKALSNLRQVAASTFDLNGTSAFIFSQIDEVASLKVLADFAKKSGLAMSFKMGFLPNQTLTASQTATLANLPGKEVLIAKFVGLANSPLRNLVFNLNWNISKLVRTLGAVAANKS